MHIFLFCQFVNNKKDENINKVFFFFRITSRTDSVTLSVISTINPLHKCKYIVSRKIIELWSKILKLED